MNAMFFNCKSIKILNLSNFITDNVTNFSNMFNNCNSLIKLNLNNFEINKSAKMKDMFKGCISLKEIKVKNINDFTRKNYNIYSDISRNVKIIT